MEVEEFRIDTLNSENMAYSLHLLTVCDLGINERDFFFKMYLGDSNRQPQPSPAPEWCP